MTEMITVRNLVKTFDGFRALDGLNLSVPSGSVYGMVGPNGAGKSSCIRCLAGIYKPDSGEILIDSSPVFENTALKSRIAYIPDDIFFYTQATIRELMKLFRRMADEGCRTVVSIPPSVRSDLKNSEKPLTWIRSALSASSARACRSRQLSGLLCPPRRILCFSMNRLTGWIL